MNENRDKKDKDRSVAVSAVSQTWLYSLAVIL